MAYDFPNTPLVGDQCAGPNGVIYEWDGEKWASVRMGDSISAITGVVAGPGLSGGGTSGAVTVSLIAPVTVSLGGTGATALAVTPGPGNWANTGTLLVSQGTSPLRPVSAADGTIGVFANAGLGLMGFGAGNPTLRLGYARGTLSAPTAVQSGDVLGAINWRGYGATNWSTAQRAAIRVTATENWTDSAQGAQLEFYTTAPAGLTTSIHSSFNNGGINLNQGDLYLVRQDVSTAWILRPSTAGYKNLAFGTVSAGTLDSVVIQSVDTTITGKLHIGTNNTLNLYDEGASVAHIDVQAYMKLVGTSNDPLMLQSATGNYCRVRYNNVNRLWTAGVGGGADANKFLVADETAAAVRLYIDTSGQVQVCVHIFPLTDNGGQCGTGSKAWNAVWAYSHPIASDPSRKTEIEALTDGALEKVTALHPVTFRWRDPETLEQPPGPYKYEPATQPEPAERRHTGFLAPDVAAVMGENFGGYVRDAESGKQGIDYAEMTAVLWKAVQELSGKLDALTKMVAER